MKKLITIIFLIFPFLSLGQDLQSNPGATGCLLLDFDGYNMPEGNFWNSGQAITADPSGMSEAEVRIAWEIVAEDYLPFNLNVTTNEAVFESYPQNKRMRCVITPTNYFFPGVNGIAFNNTFVFFSESPCWVFTNTTGITGKRIGEASSHELGHTLGLSHDDSETSGYYFGHGLWAPIMGNSLSKAVTQWSKGDYPRALNKEDDLAIIAGVSNGVGYRQDDYGNVSNQATNFTLDQGTNVREIKGIISTRLDLDVFSFTSTGGEANISIKASSQYTNLRIQATLYKEDLIERIVVAPEDNLPSGVVVKGNLPAGQYYLVIDGVGATDYDDYGSLGGYTISGYINNQPLPAILGPLSAKLVGSRRVELSWSVYQTDHRNFIVERSTDGKTYTPIKRIPESESLTYKYQDQDAFYGNNFYRIRLVQDKSNIERVSVTKESQVTISLYPNPTSGLINILMEGPITSEDMLYITDILGRKLISKEAYFKTTMDLSNLNKGTYILKYVSQNQITDKIIIKQ